MILRYISVALATVLSCIAVVMFIGGEVAAGITFAIVAIAAYINVINRHKDTLLTNVVSAHTDLFASVTLAMYSAYNEAWAWFAIFLVWSIFEAWQLKQHYENK